MCLLVQHTYFIKWNWYDRKWTFFFLQVCWDEINLNWINQTSFFTHISRNLFFLFRVSAPVLSYLKLFFVAIWWIKTYWFSKRYLFLPEVGSKAGCNLQHSASDRPICPVKRRQFSVSSLCRPESPLKEKILHFLRVALIQYSCFIYSS